MKINKYVVELWHEPGISPLSNAASQKMANRTHEAVPGLMEQCGMKMIGAYHLDLEHRSILIFEATSRPRAHPDARIWHSPPSRRSD